LVGDDNYATGAQDNRSDEGGNDSEVEVEVEVPASANSHRISMPAPS